MYLIIIIELISDAGSSVASTLDKNIYNMAKRTQYEPHQILFFLTQKLVYTVMVSTQIFEWFLYSQYIKFQSGTRTYSLVSKQKEYNSREKKYLCFFVIWLLVLIAFHLMSENFQDKFALDTNNVEI
jgi:hypothetical protein